jgi:hypothetical protein
MAGHSPAKSNREVKPTRVASTIGFVMDLGAQCIPFKQKENV